MCKHIATGLFCAATLVPACAGGTHGAALANTTEMFGHQFYPTPEPLIKRMLNFHPRNEYERLWERARSPKRILEPSAGSGTIVDFIKANVPHDNSGERVVHVCEIDPELNAMLQGKGHTVVGSDFLEFKTENPYDLIIMNPPFDAAAQHIVHAYNMLNGELVALCNAETIRNPRGEHALRLAQLIALGGKTVFAGQPFQESARTTAVEVAIVRLGRSQDHEVPEWWKNAQVQMEEFEAVSLGSEDVQPGLVRYDKIDALVSGYKKSKQAFRTFLVARQQLNSALSQFMTAYNRNLVKDAVSAMKHEDNLEVAISKADRIFGAGLQDAAWSALFAQASFGDYATAGVRKNIKHLLQQQSGMVYDRSNILGLLELLFLNRGEILMQCMLDTFDRMISFYPGNRSHWEGWKSNDAHMVNRRVVIPSTGLSYERRWGGSFTTYNINTADIDRTMAMLDGHKLSDPTRMAHMASYTDQYGKVHERSIVTIAAAVQHSIKALPTPIENHHFHDLDNTAESEYFLIRYWKKGTIHLFFKDEQLWQRFNLEAAKGKKWLPFDPDHVPTPKTKPTERKAIRELEAIAQERRTLITA